MFWLIKEVFITLSFRGSLASMAKVSNFTKSLLLSIQPCMTRAILIVLKPE